MGRAVMRPMYFCPTFFLLLISFHVVSVNAMEEIIVVSGYKKFIPSWLASPSWLAPLTKTSAPMQNKTSTQVPSLVVKEKVEIKCDICDLPAGAKQSGCDHSFSPPSKTSAPMQNKISMQIPPLVVKEKVEIKCDTCGVAGAVKQSGCDHFFCQKDRPKEGDSCPVCSPASLPRCVICLRGIKENSERRLICEHFFHPGCIEEWARNSKECPTCRAELRYKANMKCEFCLGDFVTKVVTKDDYGKAEVDRKTVCEVRTWWNLCLWTIKKRALHS